jgi:hemolysin activation/secretion protein
VKRKLKLRLKLLDDVLLVGANKKAQRRTMNVPLDAGRFPRRRHGLTCGVVLLCPLLALAQQLPTAGSVLQQMEQRRNAPFSTVPPLVKIPAPPEMTVMSGPKVIVKTVRFVGNHLLSQTQLAAVVQGYLNRPLSFTEMQQAAVAVAQTYREAGWIVRAYLPRQEIADGILIIQIVEALFGGARLEGAPATRIGTDRLLRRVESAQAKGQPLNAALVDRALLLLEDVPGVLATGSLQAGPAEGESSLLLKLEDKPLASGELGADNGGGRATGPWRVIGSVSLASPAGFGDLASATLVHTQGSDYVRFGYTVPAGYDGWRVGASASWLRYKVITPELAALDAHGTSATQGLEASYPLIRSRRRNLIVAVNYDHKSFDNSASGLVTTRYRLGEVSLGLSGNLIDAFGGGGSTGANLTLVGGKLDLDGSPNQNADALTTRSAGHFSKLRYSLSRQQVLRADLTALAALSGQFSTKNLDSGEKLYLGGSSGVRAYPSSEAGGSDGMMLNLELRKIFPGNISLTGFYDWGKVTVNHDNRFVGAAVLNDLSLRGAGIAMGWLAPAGVNLKATWSRRIGDNPNPSASGQDQDGTMIQNRFWLQASLVF